LIVEEGLGCITLFSHAADINIFPFPVLTFSSQPPHPSNLGNNPQNNLKLYPSSSGFVPLLPDGS
jgi:hypothetical protein